MAIVFNSEAPAQRDVSAEELVDQQVNAGDYFGTTSARWSFAWQLVGTRAVRLGVVNHDSKSSADIGKDETLRDALARIPAFSGDEGNFVIHKMRLRPGEFFHRMARPSDQHPNWSPGALPNFKDFEIPLIGTLNQLRSLVGMLDQIFQSVHPAPENLEVFGGTIRNLIILACTECEAQWRGVLHENGLVPERPSTNHYVKLCAAMRLDEYSVEFSHFPWIGAVKPFEGWQPANPTTSISWYDSYNATKHDREGSFSRATVKAAVNALAAVWIMVAAQFGDQGLRKFDDLRRYFRLATGPRWRYSDVYTFPYPEGENRPEFRGVNFPL